jgi:hypothetical protein
MTLE